MRLEQLWRSRSGRLSVQVLEECYVAVTRKLDPGMEPAQAREDIRALSAWRPLPIDASLVEAAWDGQSVQGVTVVNPFLHLAESILRAGR
ncbi:MAG: hypothetical protein HY702_06250 [Gemmatimonadetes bacterium]|nr:hypothetical protein [Gemmatimonadota bacterium]